LFTCIDSTIGKSGIALEDLTSNQQINAIVVNAKNSNEFLYYQLERNAYKIKLIAGEQAVPIINKSHFEAVKLICPPLPEQNAIAIFLSTWDEAIHSTTQLIAQKELSKKWLMENLLTGKKRLKGFNQEWKAIRLGDITRNFSRRNNGLIDARVYSVTNSNGFVLQSDHFEREVAGDDLSNYKLIRKNEFAYNPARINVGSIAFFKNEIGIISSLYVCFSTTNAVHDYFLEQAFKLDLVKHRIGSFGEGGVRIYLWYDLFAKIKLSIPSIQEQTAIIEILQTADNELQLLKDKLVLLKEQKKGLMQILLSGKKRLEIDN
jgi:type I restriction enzyme S subunit